MAIQSFANSRIELFFKTGKLTKGIPWAVVGRVVLRKLDMLDYAVELEDLRSPPGNRLEQLSGDLQSFYSIRVNQQWRVIFKWTYQGPKDVDVLDYH